MNLSKQKTSQAPHDFWSLIAVAYPLGMIPKAPGTWGSLPGLALGTLFYWIGQMSARTELMPFWLTVSLLLVALMCVSWYAIHRTEKRWHTHDDGRIVIDEVLGQAVSVSYLGPHPFVLVSAFVLFRVFDIWKPGPIGWADRQLPGAWGTLFDDVLAGIVVLPLVFVLSRFLQISL